MQCAVSLDPHPPYINQMFIKSSKDLAFRDQEPFLSLPIVDGNKSCLHRWPMASQLGQDQHKHESAHTAFKTLLTSIIVLTRFALRCSILRSFWCGRNVLLLCKSHSNLLDTVTMVRTNVIKPPGKAPEGKVNGFRSTNRNKLMRTYAQNLHCSTLLRLRCDF